MKKFLKQFGGKVTQEWAQVYEHSSHWFNGHFQNLEDTDLTISLKDFPGVLYKQLTHKEDREPNQPLPVAPFDLPSWEADSQNCQCIWYGHSAMMLRIDGLNILIDPMFGNNTTPIAPFATKRFSEDTLTFIDQFPKIDIVLLTHDHYDHLDLDSVSRLHNKVDQFFVALGVKRHLVSWGVAPDRIFEFDWWDARRVRQTEIIFTPTRHFSGRGISDRQKTLWGGWALLYGNERIWFSGDSGYGSHFLEIGNRLGPFDLAFMECGQYNQDWPDVHLFPDQSIQAALDAKVKKAIPVHWGGFALSYAHRWYDPPTEFYEHAKSKELPVSFPPLGVQFDQDHCYKELWWEVFQ